MRDGGKGDTPRPLGVSTEVFDKNFEAIFGKHKKLTMEEVDEGVYLMEITHKGFAEQAAEAWSDIKFKTERCVNYEKDSDKQYDAINNTEPRSSDSCGR